MSESIAIIGMSCQFPGTQKDVEDVDAFYEMLLNKQTPIKEIPKDRWDVNAYYDTDRKKENKIVTRKGGFLENPRLFDAAFFKISPTEAKQIDPQHRLFLEVSIRALNHGNITMDSLKNSNTGVYCGISTHDYSQLNLKDKINFNAYTYIGSADSAAAGRLCYFLDLKGPCITVDTACSSSLSALYVATMALRNRQCDMAIVGGVHLSLCPESFVGVSKANMLSESGLCNSFDEKADGYVRSEGCGVVIIKRLSDAIKDNHKILALLKNVSMNQDGSGMGMAAPNVEAQVTMHKSVLEQTQLDAGDINYIETHGTGTVLGDSTEFNAIKQIHQGRHSTDNPLIIGALKSNLGHTISASGIASLIKAVKAINEEKIPANLHFEMASPSIDPDAIPAQIPTETVGFARENNKKRYAQISNFGFTGTNVTAILEEPPLRDIPKTKTVPKKAYCFVVSANTEWSLDILMGRYLAYLQRTSDSLQNICYTLLNHRDHFKYRLAIIAESKDELIHKIASKAFEIKKVSVDKDVVYIENEESISADYLSGQNLKIKDKERTFTPVDLPLYPFDRKSYWHEKNTFELDATSTTLNVDFEREQDWCFNINWQAKNFENLENIIPQEKTWLFMGDEQLLSILRENGLNVVHEKEQLLNKQHEGIIYASALHSEASKKWEFDVENQKKNLKNLLSLLKRVNQLGTHPQIIILTSNAIPELADEKLDLNSSPLFGFCKTLSLELPQLQSVMIDVDDIDDLMFPTLLKKELLYNHTKSYEHVVAYRLGKRYVSRLIRSPLPESLSWSFKTKGRYLIAGGCGGLGLVSAEALLALGADEILLLSRTVDKHDIQEQINKIQSLYPNQSIQAVSLDISDRKSLNQFILENNKDGLLKGIIHSAGASLHSSLLDHQAQDIDYLFSAKVEGAWNLHELSIQHCNLDFFVAFSSVSSVFGSNKESIYSASNSSLDALIAERHRLGLVGTLIQWGPWAEVGMATKRARADEFKKALINNKQGRNFIQAMLERQSDKRVIISPDYLKFMLDFVPAPMPGFYQSLSMLIDVSSQGPTAPKASWVDEYRNVDEKNRQQVCKELLVSNCRKILNLEDSEALEEDEGFFELGFDSLMIAELSSELKNKLKPAVDISASTAFEYTTINQLSAYIDSELSNYLASKDEQQKEPLVNDDDIAIIGMSCQFPNAPDLDAFEILLENGLSGIKDIPKERWDNSKYYATDPSIPNRSYVNKLGLLDDVFGFDEQFFGISPREAILIDPQQRLFLENCYKAIEHAKYSTKALRGSLTGVYVGASASHEYYAQLEKQGLSDEHQGLHVVTGKAFNMIAGRVAYTFDLKGPALSIDTACSSALVAIHEACQSLRSNDIDYALAGGVNVLFKPESIVNLCKAKALSPESQCKTFDKNADGYVRSEGCGVVVLKRLSDALKDNDNVLAVIKASAVNNDGRSAGLTVPNGKSQEEVMLRALRKSKLASSDIDYIETHGTATPLGDPIEVHAINKVYGTHNDRKTPLYLGAVKTNIGHLESAAGVAGLIKSVISIKRKTIYKNINYKELNPNIQLNGTRLALKNTKWETCSKPISAGINAFGFSGTNAHMIVQDYPKVSLLEKKEDNEQNILIISAKSQAALNKSIEQFKSFLGGTKDCFRNICYTAATGRDHYPYRIVVIARSQQEAKQILDDESYLSADKGSKDELMADTTKQLVKDFLEQKEIDWQSFYKKKGGDAVRVAIPFYSFDKKQFKIEKKDQAEDTRQLTNFSFDAARSHLYQVSWQKQNILPSTSYSIPKITVFTNQKEKVKKALASIDLEFFDDIRLLEDIGNKHILFYFENSLMESLVECSKYLFQSKPKSFTLLTENAYAVTEENEVLVNPFHQMASAFWKSFSNELELDKNVCIDIDNKTNLPLALSQLYNEEINEIHFAIRDTLYIPGLKSIPQEALSNHNSCSFNSEASYLITGGTAGLAEPLIDYLIKRGAKHIVLTSRSSKPDKLNLILEQFASNQVSIEHHAVDVSNYSKMKQLINQIQSSSYPLKGIFHLSAELHDRLLMNMAMDEFNLVLNAKKEGAYVLHQLTMQLDLDYFVLFSSSASILGSRGQSNYVAANGFLDGLAYHRKLLGLPAIAINWGAFNTGMASENIAAIKRRGFLPMEASNIYVLDLLLSSPLPQVLYCPIDWDTYFKMTPMRLNFYDQGCKEASIDNDFLNLLKLQQSKEQQISILNNILRTLVANVLAIKDENIVGLKDDLFLLGMDSLTSLELRNQIYDRLQCPEISLPIEYFINEPKIIKISKNIANELERHFEKSKEKVKEISNSSGIALCAAQYTFWLIYKLGSSYNCGMQVQLKGALDKERLEKALDFAIQHNDVFWSSFSEDAPMQYKNRNGEFNLIYEDISIIEDRCQIERVFYQNIMRVISLSYPPLIRIYLYKLDEDIHELHIMIPHIILDDCSYRIFFEQFKKNYQNLMQGKQLISGSSEPSYFEYVNRSNIHYQKNIKEKIAFWRSYNKGVRSLSLGTENHLADAHDQDQNLYHYPMDEKLVDSFKAWHQAKNINVSTGLIAISHLMFYKFTQQNKIPLLILHSGREGSFYKSVIGLFMQYKSININLDKQFTYIEFLKSIEEQLLHTAPYQNCLPSIKQLGIEGSKLSLGQYLLFLYNRIALRKSFRKTQQHPLVIKHQLRNLSVILSRRIEFMTKYNIKKLFNLQFALLKPSRLRVLINITTSFFIKEPRDLNFYKLEGSIPNHYGSVDRPIGNETLWLYFTTDQFGKYRLSINGPLTKNCKDLIAKGTSGLMKALMANDNQTVAELLRVVDEDERRDN